MTDQEVLELSKWCDSQRMTFGFEVEGMFPEHLDRDSDFPGEWKHDGSVDMDHHISGAGTGRSKDMSFEVMEDTQEYASPVYKFSELIKALEKFTPGELHFWNYSCGLHLHVSAKTNHQRDWLKAQLYNFDFMGELITLAKGGMCPHQKKRLSDEDCLSYCRIWDNRKELRSEYYRADKYRFMNNHESGTNEFRFLCPCEHKVENVFKLVKKMKEYLSQETVIVSVSASVVKCESEPVIDSFEIQKTAEIDEAKIIRARVPSMYVTDDGSERFFTFSESEEGILRGSRSVVYVATGWEDYVVWAAQYCGYVSYGECEVLYLDSHGMKRNSYTPSLKGYCVFNVGGDMTRKLQLLKDEWRNKEHMYAPFGVSDGIVKEYSKLIHSHYEEEDGDESKVLFHAMDTITEADLVSAFNPPSLRSVVPARLFRRRRRTR